VSACSPTAAHQEKHSAAPHRLPHRSWSPDQLYEVVAKVEDYHEFVPWCVGSTILKTRPDGGYLEAELQVGFQVFVER